MFDWNDLRYFLEVSRQGRLTAAARRLHVDHTTVSRRLTALEDALGVRLFDRTPRGYKLTEDGRHMMAYAETMETASLSLYRDVAGQDAKPKGQVRLATMEAFGSQFLARNWAPFHALHPDVQVEMVAETRHHSLTKREADIAVTLVRPERGRLIASKLGAYRLRLYASPAYLQARGTPATPEELGTHDLIWYIDDLMPFSELHMMEQLCREPTVVFRTTNVTGQKNAAIAGLGIALLPCFLGDIAPELTPVLDSQTSFERDLWLVVHEDLRPLARIDAVCRFLQDTVKQNKGFLMGTKPAD